MTFARPCARCGRRISSGTYCPQCRSLQPTREQRQPYRSGYRDPDYQRNRAERYAITGGKCESCGIKLKGKLHPDGVPWECDHLVPLRDGGTSDVANLRCRCTRCHKAKTREDRDRRV